MILVGRIIFGLSGLIWTRAYDHLLNSRLYYRSRTYWPSSLLAHTLRTFNLSSHTLVTLFQYEIIQLASWCFSLFHELKVILILSCLYPAHLTYQVQKSSTFHHFWIEHKVKFLNSHFPSFQTLQYHKKNIIFLIVILN